MSKLIVIGDGYIGRKIKKQLSSRVDELVIFRSGNIIGNDGLPFVNELNFLEINQLTNYKISSLKTFEDNILEIRNLTNKDNRCSQV